jgi:hypothetical protein
MKNVALYIYIDELIDDVLTPIRHRLELFADESISVTSSIQNFRDLGKIFTDYSKAFTIPASDHNNKILYHWYNSEVGATVVDSALNLTDAFDHRITYFGYIEIDTIPFRFGKWSLKGSKKTDNKIESYSINFTGNLVQLKERFKDDKLNSLAYFEDGVRISYYDELNHLYNLANVQARLTDDNYDILYPLIGTKRKLFLSAGATAADNISTSAGKLMFNEIFPAIRVTKILEYIQGAYGITFTGAFIESLTFSRLFLYLKNQDQFTIKPEQLKINFTSKDANTRIEDFFGGFIDTATGIGFTTLDLATDVLTFNSTSINEFFDPPSTPSGYSPTIVNTRFLTLKITTASTNPYNVFVYNNGVLFSSFTNLVGTQELIIIQNQAANNLAPVYLFNFYVSSESGITFTSELKRTIKRTGFFNPPIFSGGFVGTYSEYQVVKGTSASQTTVSNIDIKSFVPDINVVTFMEGLIKMFNLMVIPTSDTSFNLQPLVNYYSDGANIDITEYVNTDSTEINPPQLFKRIAFKYEKSINTLNEIYRGLFNKEYGDLNFENQNSAFVETYEVALPFENFMFERETGTDFITATIFDKDNNAYVPKPSLIYCNAEQSVTPAIKISNTTTTNDISTYVRFSNELQLAATDLSYVQSLNWGAEISPWFLDINFNGLYDSFYSDYIENLFNQRTRILKLKAMLPTSLICSIRLKDKLIISNKRYIINTMTPELTSGETSFELILDNSAATDEGSQVLRLTNIQTMLLDNTAQEIELQIFLQNFDLWRSKVAAGYLAGTYTSGGNQYKDGLLNVAVPANTTGVNRTDDVLVEYYIGAAPTIIRIQINQYA